MKIHQITYYNHELEWRFETINFSDLNLLVGVSGVGKTQILKSIMNLQKIATKGVSLNGVEWDIEFSSEGFLYRWVGEFENKDFDNFIFENQSSDEPSDREQFKVKKEFLYKENDLIIERTDNKFIFEGNELPKDMSPCESAIKIFGQVKNIAPVQNGLKKIIYSDQRHSNDSISISEFMKLRHLISEGDFASLESIQKSNLLPQMKLALAYTYNPEIFEEIKQSFIYIFEQVEDVKIEPYEGKTPKIFGDTQVLAEYPIIKIREQGVKNWISQNRISSGMFRTLMHLTELYLSDEGTVILIDEFENSLGVNCIDILSDMLSRIGQIQYIITSHHPYIINKIKMDNWKIVTRKGGIVTVKNSKDYNLGRSKHEAFIQLINHPDYTGGIKI